MRVWTWDGGTTHPVFESVHNGNVDITTLRGWVEVTGVTVTADTWWALSVVVPGSSAFASSPSYLINNNDLLALSADDGNLGAEEAMGFAMSNEAISTAQNNFFVGRDASNNLLVTTDTLTLDPMPLKIADGQRGKPRSGAG